MTAAPTTAVPVSPRPRGRVSVGRVLLLAFMWLVLIYLVFPIFIVVPLSFSSAKYLQFPPPGFSAHRVVLPAVVFAGAQS